MTKLCKQDIQERIDRELHNYYSAKTSFKETKDNILSLISDVVIEVIGKKEDLYEVPLVKIKDIGTALYEGKKLKLRNEIRSEQEAKRKELLD